MMTDQIQLNTLLQHSFFSYFFFRYDWHAVSFDVLLCHALLYIFLTWGHCHVLGTSHERKAIVWIFFSLFFWDISACLKEHEAYCTMGCRASFFLRLCSSVGHLMPTRLSACFFI